MNKKEEKIYVILFFTWFISSFISFFTFKGLYLELSLCQYFLIFFLGIFYSKKEKYEILLVMFSCISAAIIYSIFYEYFDINKFMIVNEISLKCPTIGVFPFILVFILSSIFLIIHWYKFSKKIYKYIVYAIMIIFLIISLFFISMC